MNLGAFHLAAPAVGQSSPVTAAEQIDDTVHLTHFRADEVQGYILFTNPPVAQGTLYAPFSHWLHGRPALPGATKNLFDTRVLSTFQPERARGHMPMIIRSKRGLLGEASATAASKIVISDFKMVIAEESAAREARAMTSAFA